LVIDAFEEAEESRSVLMDPGVLIVLMGGDSSHRLVAPKRHEELGARVREVRILARSEEVKLVEDQGRHPVRIIYVNFPRELDEGLELPFVPQFDGRIERGTEPAMPDLRG